MLVSVLFPVAPVIALHYTLCPRVGSGSQPENTVTLDFFGDLAKIGSSSFISVSFSLNICVRIFFVWFVVLIDSEFSRS